MPNRSTVGVGLAGALLLAMWVSVIFLFATPETPQGYGFQHDRFTSMDQGGDPARHLKLLTPGWIFGALMIAGFVGLLAWSTDRPEETPSQRRWRVLSFVVGGVLFEASFAAVVLAYRQTMLGQEVAFIGPFPAGLFWMLFGVWAVPVYFIAQYLFGFQRWVMPAKSSQRFEVLVNRGAKESTH